MIPRSFPTSGWIEVICGCMFSGKTEELLRRCNRARYAKLEVAIFKPSVDVRYAADDVVSHSEQRLPCIPVSQASDILRNVGTARVVGIDEAQFFDEDVVEVAMRLADAGRRVVVAALDQDFKNEPFGPVPQLLAVAEFVDKLQAICQSCGGPGTRTQRLIEGRPASPEEPVIRVGAKEAYEPRCRSCHVLDAGRPDSDLQESALEEAFEALPAPGLPGRPAALAPA